MRVEFPAPGVRVLLPEPVLAERLAAPVRLGHHALRHRERAVTELVHRGGEHPADLAEVGRLRRVAATARTLPPVRPGESGRAELPLDLGVVRLELLVGDRPVHEARPVDLAEQRPHPEVVDRHPGHHPAPVRRAASDHLRGRGEVRDDRLLRLARPDRARLELRVLPQVVAVEDLDLVTGGVLRFQPRASLEAHHPQSRLGEHLGGRRAAGPDADDDDVGRLGLPLGLLDHLVSRLPWSRSGAGPGRPVLTGLPPGGSPPCRER